MRGKIDAQCSVIVIVVKEMCIFENGHVELAFDPKKMDESAEILM